MERFDLGLAYVWEYDEDFIDMLEERLHLQQLTTYRISNYNFHEVKELIQKKKITFRYYLDRAGDVDEDFEALGKLLTAKRVKIINPYSKVLHAIDKASMHLEFITAKLNTPYSIIIPPHSESEELLISVNELARLGRPFIIKPCNTTGGGIGVVTGAESLKEVLEERVTNKDDKYLLQEKIYPTYLDSKRAWFRCFWAFGKAIAVWWDDQTHVYEELTEDEIARFKLKKLFQITKTISRITKLNFFSTEVVLTDSYKFIVIDYVNDQCDMRLKSKHIDGVPDNVILDIINSLIKFIRKE